MSVTIGLFNFKEIATGELKVLAEYLALVFGGLAAWMSWRHSRRA
jgi:hypothetical protein